MRPQPPSPNDAVSHVTIDLDLPRSEQAKQLYQQALDRLPLLKEWLEGTLRIPGVAKHLEGVKDLSGIAAKVGRADWLADGKEWRDIAHVTDALRSTSVVTSAEAISDLVDSLPDDCSVAQVKDRYSKPTDLGYVDINVTLRDGTGYLIEFQINFPEMMEAKEGVGHLLYEVARQLGDPTQMVEGGYAVETYRSLRTLQRKLYTQALQSFADRAGLSLDQARASLKSAADSWSSKTRLQRGSTSGSADIATVVRDQSPPDLKSDSPSARTNTSPGSSSDSQAKGPSTGSGSSSNDILNSNTCADDPGPESVPAPLVFTGANAILGGENAMQGFNDPVTVVFDSALDEKLYRSGKMIVALKAARN